jgi:hypothetical protein
MPPIRTNEIIDLCSSPPGSSPSPIRVRTRSQSRARSVGPKDSAKTSKTPNLKASDAGKNPGANARRKGKGKQPFRSLGPVIELTDSEDENENETALTLAGTQSGEQNKPSYSSSGVASGSGNASGSALNDEQVKRDGVSSSLVPQFNLTHPTFSNPGSQW